MEEIAKILSNYGFPVAVATFLLVRLERRMETLEKTITELSGKIEELCAVTSKKRR